MANPIFKTIADLPVAGAMTGAETIEVIQGGESRQMTLGTVTAVETVVLQPAATKTGFEVIEVTQAGEQRTMGLADAVKFDRYDTKVMTTTGAMDLNVAQVYKIDNTTAGTKTVTIANAPAGRALNLIVKIAGKVGTVQWPAGSITWDASKAPELGAASTIVVLFWDGSEFNGSQGATI